MEIIFFLIIFSIGIGAWANAWGRNGWTWGIIAALLSPLLVGIALIIAGKSVEKKAEEAKRIKELVG